MASVKSEDVDFENDTRMNMITRRSTPAPCVICNDHFSDSDEMIFCPNCGEPYHNELRKPHNCWKAIGRKCKVRPCQWKEYSLWARLEKPFVQLLGVRRTKLKTRCSRCNSSMSALHQYCMNCGYEINDAEARDSFLAYPFAKWVRFNHRILLTILSVFFVSFLWWGGTMTVSAVENYVHQRQTEAAHNQAATQRSSSATSIIAQNKTATAERKTATAVSILSLTPTPTKTPRPTSTRRPTNTPRPTATRVPFKPYTALPDCAQARVIIGDIVEPTTDLFIRSNSDNHPSNNIISHLKPGQAAEVIAGPECSWKWMMWKIRRLSDGFEGWVAESDGNEFWLKLED